MSVVFDVILEVQDGDVVVEGLWVELWVADDALDAHDLERLRFFVASQAPLAGFNQHVVMTMAAIKIFKTTRRLEGVNNALTLERSRPM